MQLLVMTSLLVCKHLHQSAQVRIEVISNLSCAVPEAMQQANEGRIMLCTPDKPYSQQCIAMPGTLLCGLCEHTSFHMLSMLCSY